MHLLAQPAFRADADPATAADARLEGLRRTKGARPVRKAALLEPNLRAASLVLIPEVHPDLAGAALAGGGGRRARTRGWATPAGGVRDMALLLIGFAGGFRRSELAAFDLRDVGFTAEGLVLFVGRSKADQERHGAEVGIEAVPESALCAVTALRRWLEARGDAPGALFCRLDRGGNLVAGADGRLLAIDPATIARVVKRAVTRTGIGAADFSAHSLPGRDDDRRGPAGRPAREGDGAWAVEELRLGPDLSTARSLWVGNFTGRLLAEKSRTRTATASSSGPSPLAPFEAARALPKRTSRPPSELPRADAGAGGRSVPFADLQRCLVPEADLRAMLPPALRRQVVDNVAAVLAEISRDVRTAQADASGAKEVVYIRQSTPQ